jgi:hypothetical protein
MAYSSHKLLSRDIKIKTYICSFICMQNPVSHINGRTEIGRRARIALSVQLLGHRLDDPGFDSWQEQEYFSLF